MTGEAALLGGAVDELHRLNPVERAAQEHRTLLAEDLAVDGHEVALLIVVHAEIAGQNNAATVGVFFPQSCISQEPKTAVSMHVKQLSFQPAEIRRVIHARFIPTAKFK